MATISKLLPYNCGRGFILSLLYISCCTKSSFEIERIKPSASRVEKFIALLTLAEAEDFCDKDRFIELQKMIVDPRFAGGDFIEAFSKPLLSQIEYKLDDQGEMEVLNETSHLYRFPDII